MPTDKRKHARFQIDLAVQIEMANGTWVRGRLVDVSQGGAYLKVEHTKSTRPVFAETATQT
jgi:c-di-GMP-binding flagellar brake protein YcgR